MISNESVGKRIESMRGEKAGKKAFSVTIQPELHEATVKCAEVLDMITDKDISVNTVVEMALQEFTKATIEYFEAHHNIDLKMETIESLRELEFLPIVHEGEIDFDTVTFPAQEENFEPVFLKRHVWYPMRIAKDKVEVLQAKESFMSLYRGAPVSALTHYARITAIVPDVHQPDRWVLHTEEPIELDTPVVLGDATQFKVRPNRYIKLENLKNATCVMDLFPNETPCEKAKREKKENKLKGA
jgi:hypothetical protein